MRRKEHKLCTEHKNLIWKVHFSISVSGLEDALCCTPSRRQQVSSAALLLWNVWVSFSMCCVMDQWCDCIVDSQRTGGASRALTHTCSRCVCCVYMSECGSVCGGVFGRVRPSRLSLWFDAEPRITQLSGSCLHFVWTYVTSADCRESSTLTSDHTGELISAILSDAFLSSDFCISSWHLRGTCTFLLSPGRCTYCMYEELLE